MTQDNPVDPSLRSKAIQAHQERTVDSGSRETREHLDMAASRVNRAIQDHPTGMDPKVILARQARLAAMDARVWLDQPACLVLTGERD